MQMFHKKGQGATEYLVLLAVVLIVAMVAIALLGFFPGLAGDAKIAQSDAYWRGTSRPFAILEHSMSSSSSNLTLVIQNVDADQREITQLSMGGSGLSGTSNSSDPASDFYSTSKRFFSSGEKKTIYMDMGANCTSGNSYELYVNFTYNTGSITGLKQFGEKTLVGRCN